MKLVKILLAAMLSLCFAVTAFAADDIVFEFTDEKSAIGWGYENVKFKFNDGGYIECYAVEQDANKSDAIMYSPKIDINAEDYRYVVVTMKYAMDATWSRNSVVYFKTDADTTWSAANSASSARLENTAEYEFVDVVIDMKTCDKWTGKITQFRFDPFNCHGSFDVKSIKLTNTAPEAKNEETPGVQTPAKKTPGYFEKPNTYNNNFNDVPASEWYAKEVANAYELGLVGGKGEGIFDPNGYMTIAEAVTIASRAKNNYGTADYTFVAEAGEEWFAPYVKYAISNGIIKDGDFADYNANVTRAQMAYIFANTLPSSEYAYINSVSVIPDVKKDAPYAPSIYKLYNAGIVMGNDAYGSFNPDNNIIRCEAAAIINRIANKDNRVAKNLVSTVTAKKNGAFTSSSEAKYLIDLDRFYNKFEGGVPSGWTLSRTMTEPEKSGIVPFTYKDDSTTFGGEYQKKFPKITDGVLGLEFGAVINAKNGVYLALSDENGNSAVKLSLENGKFIANGTDTGVPYSSSSVHFNMYVNLTASTFDLGIDGAYAGTYTLSNADGISLLSFGTTKEATGSISASYVNLTHNYLAFEKFVNAPDNILPYNLTFISDGGRVYKDNTYKSVNNGEGGNAVLASKANGKTGVSGSFAASNGNVVFETYIYLPDDVNGARIALKNASADAFFIETRNGSFISPDGTAIKNVTKNLWTIVRIEADTTTGKALVKINGKACGEYAFAASAIDGYEITYTPVTESKMHVDGISAFVKKPYPADYVPEPVIPESDDYYVGINVCSLWRTGITHRGWDVISSYPEIEPVLGYYDEGTPEVADWEIKFMAEHGIDYQLFCWYADEIIDKPIYRTDFNDALIDGYMNARYSNKMDFAIMWENAVTTKCSAEAFRNYVVPYWIEYFFKDDRYVKLDNKPLVAIFNYTNLGNYFGGADKAKENLDYLRSECIKAGFDGCEIWAYYSGDYTESVAGTLKTYGFDGMCVYGWGADGADVNYQLDKITKQGNVKTLGTVPTISVGFDYVGWGNSEKRNGLLDPADFSTLADYVKTNILAKRDASSPYAKTVLISTWNEYGEGTYVMPTERYGFAYLDEIRKAFTAGTDHTDVTPNDTQKARINNLFDQSRRQLRNQLLEDSGEAEFNPYEGFTSVYSITFETPEKASLLADYGTGYKYYSKDGVLQMDAFDGKDPAIFMKSKFKGVSTRTADAILVRAKIDVEDESRIQLYFTTEEEPAFGGDRGAELAVVNGKWHDYIFDMRGKDSWKDKITNIRVDVSTTPYKNVQIECIELIKLPEAPDKYTVDINGFVLDLIKAPEIAGDAVMIPVTPETGMLHRMMATYLWDKDTNTIVISAGGHTVKHTVGTNVMNVDGASKTLPKNTYMFDGVPVLPIDYIAEALGYFAVDHEDKNGVSIMLGSASDYEFVANRVKNEYEFNLMGDVEDWTTQNCEISVHDGALHGVCTTTDPGLYSPALSVKADDYLTLEVRMKWKDAAPSGNRLTVFFWKDRAGLSGIRALSTELPAPSSDEFVTFEIDLTEHLQWYGTITGIRVDPINQSGEFEIDYIRLKKDVDAELREKYESEREMNLDDTIFNGDAEILAWNPMVSENADVTMVIRDDYTSYCYNVKARTSNAFTNCQQAVKFVPGTKYVLEYDVRLVSTTLGDTTPELGTTVVVSAVYNEGDGLKNHIAAGGALTIGDGWVHVKSEFTVSEACTNEGDMVSIFLNPKDGIGFHMQLDNITLSKAE